MTADRIVEFQRASILRQEQHLTEALRRLRIAERKVQEHAAELELQRDHNATLFALLLQRDRQMDALRAELLQVRAALDGVQTGEPR